MTAHSDLGEGDTIGIPCAHCASLSIQIELHAGVADTLCGKCGERTSLTVKMDSSGWSITTCKVDAIDES